MTINSNTIRQRVAEIRKETCALIEVNEVGNVAIRSVDLDYLTDTITALLAEREELAAERRSLLDAMEGEFDSANVIIERDALRQQLTAAQAENAALRNLLRSTARSHRLNEGLCWCPRSPYAAPSHSDRCKEIRAALKETAP